MDLRATQKHAIRGKGDVISFSKVKLPFNVSCLIYRRVKPSLIGSRPYDQERIYVSFLML